jgi:glycosyltransferase involved in cell wall biosynthesis
MKLCLSLPGDWTASGYGRVTAALAGELAALGHEVHLLAPAHPAQLRTPVPGTWLHQVPPLDGGPLDLPGAGLLSAAARLYRAVRAIHSEAAPVHLVELPVDNGAGVICALDGRFVTALKCITTSQQGQAFAAGPPSRYAAVATALERAAVARASLLRGPTRAALEHRLAQGPADPAALTVAVSQGLADRCPPAARAAPARPVTPTDPLRILFVGRIEPRKGPELLVEAVRRLIDHGCPVTLTLAGPIPDSPFGEAVAAAAARLPHGVTLAGVVSDAERDRLMSACDVVCVPTRWESQGVVPVEAMMFARPLVSCPVGGIPEVVLDGQTGLLVAPGDPGALADALARLAADPELRSRLGSAARARYEAEFTLTATTARVEDAYVSAVEAFTPAATSAEEIRRRLAEIIVATYATGLPEAIHVAERLVPDA